MSEHDRVRSIIQQKEQAPVAIDIARTALVVVDAQRFFTRPEAEFAQVFQRLSPGVLDGYFERVNTTVLPNIRYLQESFRTRGLPVIFCVFGSAAPDAQDLPGWLKDFDQLGLRLLGRRPNPAIDSESWQIDERVAPLSGEMIVNKASSGALSTTTLDQTLRNMGISSLVICGLTTAVCVGLTARQAADRDFRVVIAGDACTELSDEMHEAALLSFSHVFGQVRRTRDLADFLTVATDAMAEQELT
jgi:nicotinamidase-related amidase